MVRPTAVTVFGVLFIVFGLLGVVCTPLALALPYLFELMGVPYKQPLPELQTLNLVMYCCHMGLDVFMLAAGIGLMSMKAWSRRLSLGVAAVDIVLVLVGLVGMLAVLLSAPASSGPEAVAARIGGLIGGCIGGTIGLVLPICALVFLSRPEVKQAFLEHGVTVGNDLTWE